MKLSLGRTWDSSVGFLEIHWDFCGFFDEIIFGFKLGILRDPLGFIFDGILVDSLEILGRDADEDGEGSTAGDAAGIP